MECLLLSPDYPILYELDLYNIQKDRFECLSNDKDSDGDSFNHQNSKRAR
jgi:hypothetical protein